MLRHYIKMAMRHLLKNKIQNLISIVGLSVGILCFSICLYCSRFISEVDSCFSNKELIADINLCTTRGDCKHSASCVFFSPLFLPTFVASL